MEEVVTHEIPMGVTRWDTELQLSPATSFLLLKMGFRLFKKQKKADQKLFWLILENKEISMKPCKFLLLEL